MPDFRLIALAALFALWWVISVLNQFRSGAWTLRLRRHIPFGLIPLWTFFAPNPARADSRLVWREEYVRGWSGWRELHFGFAPLAGRWVINPELILNKAVTDLSTSLLLLRPELEDRCALLNSSYLTLLSIVLAQPREAGSLSVQFALVRSANGSATRSLDVVFLSEAHEVAGTLNYVC